MNEPTVTLELHQRYINLILGSLDQKEIEDKIIVELTSLLDPNERYFHVEGKMVWKIKPWKDSVTRRDAEKQRLEELKTKIDKRKAYLELLTLRVQSVFVGLDTEMARKLAWNMLHKQNVGAAAYFGVDLNELPPLEQPHWIINEKGEYVEL